LRQTEIKNRGLDMVDAIWSGLVLMGAACQVYEPPAEDTHQSETVETKNETLKQQKDQNAARENHLVMMVDPTNSDNEAIQNAERDYNVTLTEVQRALQRANKFQEWYGLDQEQWGQITKAEITKVDKKIKDKGKMPQSTWASRYGDKAMAQYQLLQNMLPYRGNVQAQEELIDALCKQVAATSTDKEDDGHAQKKRVVRLYKAKTAVDILKLLGFSQGIFDTTELTVAAMFPSEGKKNVAKAIHKWTINLEMPNESDQRLKEQMEMIMNGKRSRTSAKKMLSMLNNRFLNDSLGIQVVLAKRRRNEEDVPWRLVCNKFRVPDFNDDGDVTRPLVREPPAAASTYQTV